MNQVIYFSRGGNTAQVAKAIASGLGVKAIEVANARIGPVGTIFLGSGCYGGSPGPKMMEFIEKNELSGRDVALFGTSGGGKGDELRKMEETLKKKGATVLGKFHCKGKTFILINRKHPDGSDLSNAKIFAREMAHKR